MACLAGMFSPTTACRLDRAPAGQGADADSVPSDVFRPWDGTWKGRFYVKDGTGRTLTALDVQQTYRSTSPNRQLGYFREVDLATQKITTATATNSHDGRSMRCEVTKSTGEHVVHSGRWTGQAIEWSRSSPKARELFSEHVSTGTDGATYYDIRGWGEYDGGPRLHFEGRYRKQ